MIALCCKIAALLLVGFTTALVALHAQAYDDHGLREFLASGADCKMPCFLGIRPDVTMVDDAITLLENHPWVKTVHAPIEQVGYAVTWEWSGLQPAWLSDHRGLLQLRGRVVRQILLTTTLSYGDLWLAFRAPERMMYQTTFDPTQLVYTSVFDDGIFQSQSTVQCPISPQRFWNEPQGIQIPAKQYSFMVEVSRADSPHLNKVMCP